jgi:anaerobic magnesium-protoporphyrin IX monomethyl ester cyclase
MAGRSTRDDPYSDGLGKGMAHMAGIPGDGSLVEILDRERPYVMKIAFVSVENSLSAIGFRKMTALVRRIQPELGVFYVVPFKAASPWNRLSARTYQGNVDSETDAIAAQLANSEMVCFSSMSTHAEYTRNLIQAVRLKNPAAFIVWGGIHCIVDPEDAIRYADAVCVGEGEKAFPEFLSLLMAGHDYTRVGNFWFNSNGRVTRNALLPLQTNDELGSRPYPLFAEGELLYKPGRGFIPLEALDQVRLEGLSYHTVWSMGCPNQCNYCGNSKFLKNDKNYGRLRFPPVDYIVGEVIHARERYPHFSSVTFHDDLFMAIPMPVLEEFAEKWRERVTLPFAVHGLMSRYVDPQKMKLLISAGMFRVRMGIQSGSPRTLRFYRRPDSRETIEDAIGEIHRFSKYMMTPSYDVIVDNPTETNEDIAATIRLIHAMPRPFILNVFPLMLIPGTELAEIAKESGLDLPYINQGHLSGSYANALLLMLCLWRPPKRVLEFLLKRMAKPGAAARPNPIIVRILVSGQALKRARAHLRFGHFSVMPGKIAWTLWNSGIVKYANRRILRRCSKILPDPSSDGVSH